MTELTQAQIDAALEAIRKLQESATIERCAQEVKELIHLCSSSLGCVPYARQKLQEAEAAIQALKEQP